MSGAGHCIGGEQRDQSPGEQAARPIPPGLWSAGLRDAHIPMPDLTAGETTTETSRRTVPEAPIRYRCSYSRTGPTHLTPSATSSSATSSSASAGASSPPRRPQSPAAASPSSHGYRNVVLVRGQIFSVLDDVGACWRRHVRVYDVGDGVGECPAAAALPPGQIP